MIETSYHACLNVEVQEKKQSLICSTITATNSDKYQGIPHQFIMLNEHTHTISFIAIYHNKYDDDFIKWKNQIDWTRKGLLLATTRSMLNIILSFTVYVTVRVMLHTV